MRINDIPAQRRNYDTASRTNGHLHEGKFADITASGEIAVATSATQTTRGVISEPDSALANKLGHATGATLIWHTHGGIVQVKAGATPGNITPGTPLKLTADGRVEASTGTAGDRIVAEAVDTGQGIAPNSLFGAVMVKPYTIPAEA